MHLVKGGPQRAVGVSVQFFIFGQTEECPVTLTLSSSIQIPAGWKTQAHVRFCENIMKRLEIVTVINAMV